MEFFYFKKDVEAAFVKMMEAGKLFIVNVDNDLLWMGYLLSFPEEKRQEHNCNACKSFIRHVYRRVGSKIGFFRELTLINLYPTV